MARTRWSRASDAKCVGADAPRLGSYTYRCPREAKQRRTDNAGRNTRWSLKTRSHAGPIRRGLGLTGSVPSNCQPRAHASELFGALNSVLPSLHEATMSPPPTSARANAPPTSSTPIVPRPYQSIPAKFDCLLRRLLRWLFVRGSMRDLCGYVADTLSQSKGLRYVQQSAPALTDLRMNILGLEGSDIGTTTHRK